MLKLYLSSIIIYAIIIFGILFLYKDKYRENGYTNDPENKRNGWVLLLVMSAIPVIRCMVAIMLVIMAGMTKEEFDDWIKEETKK